MEAVGQGPDDWARARVDGQVPVQGVQTCGRLVFSHAPPVPGSYGVQGMYGGGFTGRRTWVYRWAYEPETWAALLGEHGFVDVDARVHPAPEDDLLGTLIVTARRPT